MKKTLFYISLAVLAISCVKEQNPGTKNTQKILEPMEFNALTEGVTKTALAADGSSVEWIEGDEVLIFDGSNLNDEGTTDNGVTFTAQSSGASVVISGSADPAAAEYYALYPKTSGKMSTSNVFTSKVGSQQIVTAGTMADDYAVMIAKADGKDMQFKNVTALVEFNLQVDDVRSLTLIGNNNEKITGSFTAVWNEGQPVATPGIADVTATLRAKNNADLAKGKYYFTILPTNFTKGFSVILGMNDGTQKIVKREAAADIKRNQIFCTQDVPAAAIKAHVSNFVKYNDGFDLTYGNLTINKSTCGDAVYVNDSNNSITTSGIYFINPKSTNVESNFLRATKLVIACDDPSQRVDVEMKLGLQPYTSDDGFILLSGLNLKNSLQQLIYQHSEGFTKYGNIVISDCKVLSTAPNSMAVFRAINAAFTLETFEVRDSDILLSGARADMYLFIATKSSTINNFILYNNVFHNTLWKDTVNNKLTKFYLANSSAATVGNISVTNNTLSVTMMMETIKQFPMLLARPPAGKQFM